MLTLESVRAGYDGVEVLHNVNLSIAPGTVLALLGPNGAGKTTLARVIAGLLSPSDGRILLGDADLTRVAAHRRIRHGVALVPEDKGLFQSLSVQDNLDLGTFARGRQARRESIDRVFGLFPVLAERRQQAAGDLSGGQQQMLAIGRALMARPTYLVLDEPSLGLSPLVMQAIFGQIRDLATEGVGVLLVEQNARRALMIADHAAVLERGRMVVAGSAAEVRADPRVESSYLGEAV